jgi:glycerophosphoryl diester phosphodiesterase
LILLKKSPLIIGHRGASALAPENTLAAFARAFDDGADGIELDVRLARDGVPVVIHDSSLWHTGRRKARVARLTSEKLGQIDVGTSFNRQHRPMARVQYMKQTVPTLEEVFKLMADSARQNTVCYVEMKAARKKKSNLSLAATVVEIIQRHNFHNRAIVISFNLPAITAIKEIDPSIRTGALFGPRQRATKSAHRIIKEALECDADEILLHHLIAKRRILALALEANVNPVVWTVDDPWWITRARENRVHALMPTIRRSFWRGQESECWILNKNRLKIRTDATAVMALPRRWAASLRLAKNTSAFPGSPTRGHGPQLEDG